MVEGELLALVVGGERRPLLRRPLLRRPLLRRPCDAGLVVEGARARVVGGAVEDVDNGNEVNGTTATSVVGGADVVDGAAPVCLGTVVLDCSGPVLLVRFGGGGFLLGEWPFCLDGAFLREWAFLALWAGLGGGWTVVVVKAG